MSENPFLLGEKLSVNRSSTPSARFSQLSVLDTITELQTDAERGLSNNQDVLNRRSLHGINELSSEEEESLFMKFISSFYSDPLILLLIGSAVISFWMATLTMSCRSHWLSQLLSSS
ncbi:hypothetical protein OXX80_011287, partial [Metschnikowia pulcherrima]